MSDQTLTIVAASVVTSVIVSLVVARFVARRFKRRERELVQTARRMGEWVGAVDRQQTETGRELYSALKTEATIGRAKSRLYKSSIEDVQARAIRAGMLLDEIAKKASSESINLLDDKNKSPRR